MKMVFYTAAVNQRASRWEYPFPLARGHLTLESMPDLRCECDRVHSAEVNRSPGAPLRAKSTHL